MSEALDCVTIDADQQSLLRSVHTALKDAFGHRFELWLPIQDGDSADARWIQAHGPGADFDIQSLVAQVAAEPSTPLVFDDGDYQMKLVVPFIRQKRLAVVATARFTDDSPDLLVRLARMVVRAFDQGEQIERYIQETETYAEQISQNFEELTFLRNLAEHLEITDNVHDMVVMARTILPLLNRSMQAKTLLLVTTKSILDHGQDRSAEHGKVAVRFGEDSFDDPICLRLIDLFFDPESRIPQVMNNVHQSATAEQFPGLREFILVPIRKGNHHMGWLVALNCKHEATAAGESPSCGLSHEEFGMIEATLLCSAASILATHATNVSLLFEKEQLLVNVVRALVSAIDAKDPHIRGHSERVAMYARRLAQKLGLDELTCEQIYLAGMLHDVGKISVPDVVLLKTGALTEHESQVMQQHPDQGWSILHDVTQIKYVLPGVLHHHERFDGNGYPDGLAGSDIPLIARMLAVVGAYDAMSHSRRYRQSLSHDETLQALQDGAGTQWDPEIVEAFLAIVPDVISIRDSYSPPAICQRR